MSLFRAPSSLKWSKQNGRRPEGVQEVRQLGTLPNLSLEVSEINFLFKAISWWKEKSSSQQRCCFEPHTKGKQLLVPERSDDAVVPETSYDSFGSSCHSSFLS